MAGYPTNFQMNLRILRIMGANYFSAGVFLETSIIRDA